MATKSVYVNKNFHKQEIQNVSLEKLAVDPTGSDLYEGRIWENTVSNKVKYYDGTVVQTLATIEDITSIGAFQGVHDASGGLVPSTTTDGSAIVAGDYWRVSIAGTIVGIGGSDVLEIGDLIFAITSGASVATNFTAVQNNLNLPNNIALVEEVTLATLAANTVTAIPTTFTNVYSIQIFDSSNNLIELDITGVTSAPMVESNVALSGLKIRIVGN